MTPLETVVALLLPSLYWGCFALVMWLCGRASALHYDAHQLGCAYNRAARGYKSVAVYVALACMMMMVVVTYPRPPVPIHVIFSVGIAMAAVVHYVWVDARRAEQRWQLLSARYMQHKYGIDEALLLPLLGRHGRPFPVYAYEAALGLTTAEAAAYSAGGELRKRMTRLVQSDFLEVLWAGGLLASWRSDVNDDVRHVRKMRQLESDWYSGAGVAAKSQ